MDDQQKCPYCGELIKSKATKCRFCGEWLIQKTQPGGNDSESHIKWALAEKYEIQQEVGHGGMAVVYKAIQKNLDRVVALKILPQQFTHDKEFLERFHREARQAARLSHPNIVAIYDEGIENGVHYIAMEFLDGIDLHALIKQKRYLSIEQAINYISPIAEALEYAHLRGIVHRDIKSANIIVTNSGRPVLTDFGIAFAASGTKLTNPGAVVGTPEYMSPEQAEGAGIDGRSDIFSLGIVLFESVTGQVPFKGDNPITTIYKIVHDNPVSPKSLRKDIPIWFEGVITKCLFKNPSNRFQRGTELSEALRKQKSIDLNIVDGRSRTIKISSKIANLRKEKQSISFSGILISVIIILIAILSFLVLRPGSEPSSQVFSNSVGDEDFKDGNWNKFQGFEKGRIKTLLDEAAALYSKNNLVNPPGKNAVEIYKEVLRLHSTNVTALQRLDNILKDLINKAEGELAGNNSDQAKSIYQQVSRYYPDNSELRNLEKRIYVSPLEKRLQEYVAQEYEVNVAYDYIQDILKIDPDNNIASTALKNIYNRYQSEGEKAFVSGKWSRAADLFRDGLKYFRDDNNFSVKLSESQQKIKVQSAQEKINRTLSQADNCLRSADWDCALSRYAEVLQLSPGNPRATNYKDRVLEAITRLGDTQREKKDYEAAVQTYGKALELNPDNKLLKIKRSEAELKK